MKYLVLGASVFFSAVSAHADTGGAIPHESGLASTTSPAQACEAYKNIKAETNSKPALRYVLPAITGGATLTAYLMGTNIERSLIAREFAEKQARALEKYFEVGGRIASDVSETLVRAINEANVSRIGGPLMMRAGQESTAASQSIADGLRVLLRPDNQQVTARVWQVFGIPEETSIKTLNLIAKEAPQQQKLLLLVRKWMQNPGKIDTYQAVNDLRIILGAMLGQNPEFNKDLGAAIGKSIDQELQAGNAALRGTLKCYRTGAKMGAGATITGIIGAVLWPSDVSAATLDDDYRKDVSRLLTLPDGAACQRLERDPMLREYFMLANQVVHQAVPVSNSCDQANDGPNVSMAQEVPTYELPKGLASNPDAQAIQKALAGGTAQ